MPPSSKLDHWRLVRGWPTLTKTLPTEAFPDFRLPDLQWDKVEVWNAGVGGSKYLLVIAHRANGLTKPYLDTLSQACDAADMWFVIEPSFYDGIMVVVTSFWNEFYS